MRVFNWNCSLQLKNWGPGEICHKKWWVSQGEALKIPNCWMIDVHLRFHKKHEDIDIWLVVEPTL
jgi:hypothetical protein